jgi:hypothetical protein
MLGHLLFKLAQFSRTLTTWTADREARAECAIVNRHAAAVAWENRRGHGLDLLAATRAVGTAVEGDVRTVARRNALAGIDRRVEEFKLPGLTGGEFFLCGFSVRTGHNLSIAGRYWQVKR